MKCPNCNKEVSNDKNYCEYCGSPLYGPRSINLNTFNNNAGHSNINQDDNIKSITGIDINDIVKNSISLHIFCNNDMILFAVFLAFSYS